MRQGLSQREELRMALWGSPLGGGGGGIRTHEEVARASDVAVKREQGMEFNPDPSYTLTAGDVLVVLGEDLDIVQFQVGRRGSSG